MKINFSLDVVVVIIIILIVPMPFLIKMGFAVEYFSHKRFDTPVDLMLAHSVEDDAQERGVIV